MITIEIVADRELLISLNERCLSCHGKGTYYKPTSSIDPYGPCPDCDGKGYYET